MSHPTYPESQGRRRKPLVWLHGEVKTPPFSPNARIEAGVLLGQLQQGVGLSLPQSRPMANIARSCHELRIHDQHRTWRIVYFIDDEAIVILEIFARTTSQTPQAVLTICKLRLGRYRAVSQEKQP